MKILVLNAGSSSIKYTVFEGIELKTVAKGVVEKIGDATGHTTHKYLLEGVVNKQESHKEVRDHQRALEFIVKKLLDRDKGVIEDISDIKAVGHRVVHGGEYFSQSHLVNNDLKNKVKELIPLAPLHNPANLLGIEIGEKIFKKAIQVAVFDTSFHQTIPDKAYRYAVPDPFYFDFGIRVYGMHGTSHRYVSERAAEYLEKDKYEVNLVNMHLGNGCSASAVRNGKCIDTTMGLSPLPGLVMGTRSGDIDPSIIFHLIREYDFSSEEVETILNKQSGLKGLTGLTDLRDILKLKDKGDKKAQLALDIYTYRIKKYIGSYMAAVGPTDAIVFTAGVGENSPYIRAKSVEGLSHLGIEIDNKLNEKNGKGIRELQSPLSKVKILVVPTDEEKQIALSTARFLN